MTQKEIKALQKEEEQLRHKIDAMLTSQRNVASKENWAIIDRLVEVNILLEEECNK